MTVGVEPKRIKDFRLHLAGTIPRSPNNRESLQELEAMPLATLIVQYSNWASRFVRPRPRKITIEPEVTADKRWKYLAPKINSILDKARYGEDLAPHLSILAHKRGYVAKSAITPGDKWADKDLLLNVMGYHHLHLSSILEPAGHFKRTNEVLFAKVSRDTFVAIGIFDHSVFDMTDSLSQTLTAERERLWKVFETRDRQPMTPGAVYLNTAISTSGNAYWQTRLAIDHARMIYEMDQKLDDLSYAAELFQINDRESIRRLKPRWRLNFLDLGLLDEKSQRFVRLRTAPF